MAVVSAEDSKFQLLPLLSSKPFASESSTLTIQDLLYDLRLFPLAQKCMAVRHVPKHPFVVTKVTCYHQQSTWLGHQHAYVVLKIQPHPSQPQPSWSHVSLKIFKSNKLEQNPPVISYLGDSSCIFATSIIDSPAAGDKVVHPELSWSPEQAPSLFRVINLIIKVTIVLDWGWFKSCHILAAAILDAVYDVFDDTPKPHKTFPLIYQPYSFRMNYAARIARRTCDFFRAQGKPECF